MKNYSYRFLDDYGKASDETEIPEGVTTVRIPAGATFIEIRNDPPENE